MKAILQHDIRDCGAACFAYICREHGLKLPLSKCCDLTKSNKTGTNIYGIVKAAEAVGFSATSLSGNIDELIEGVNHKEIATPFIAHVVSDGILLHFVVVCDINDHIVKIMDPAKGLVNISLENFSELWTGYIINFIPTDAFKKGNYTKGSFSKFFSLLNGQYSKMIGILLISLIVAAIDLIGALSFQAIVDNFATQTGYYETVESDEHDHSDGDDCCEEAPLDDVEDWLDRLLKSIVTHFNSYASIFVCLIGLYFVQAAVVFIRGYLIAVISKEIDIRLAIDYYCHIIDLSLPSIGIRQTGEYLSRFSDMSTIRTAVSTATLTLLLDTVTVIGCGFILFAESPQMFVVSLVIILLYSVVVLVLRKPIEKSNRNVMESNACVQSYFKESIDGISTVKETTAENEVKAKAKILFDVFINSIFKSSYISIIQDSLTSSIELIGAAIILWIGFNLVTHGQITIGALISFYILLGYFTEPIKNIIQLQPTIQSASIAAERLNDILDMDVEIVNTDGSVFPELECLRMENIDFRYDNAELTLCKVNMCVKSGEKVAIIGESGSGKTTLSKLLLRFYDPENGRILLNGKNLRNYNLRELRNQFAYVDQTPYFFTDTIKNNLKLGNNSLSDNDIVDTCKMCMIHDFISSLPLGYDTPIDENGNNLSGGQKQRLSLARALLRKPQLLILDEATSNLDSITEASIQNTILQLDNRITIIIIAHRLSTIEKCDRIYVMENGHFIEEGTHKELMDRQGKYSQFIAQQKL